MKSAECQNNPVIIKKKLVELSLAACLKRQSKETGFLHVGDRIPIYLNLCFSLSLLKSKTGENLQKGIKLLKRLLQFVNDDGKFPTYLHDYPYGRKVNLFPLVLIKKEFSIVLEKSVLDAIDSVLQKNAHSSEHRKNTGNAENPENAENLENVASSENSGNDRKGKISETGENEENELFHLASGSSPFTNEYSPNLGVCNSLLATQNGFEPDLTLEEIYYANKHAKFFPRHEEDHLVHIEASLLDDLEMDSKEEPFTGSEMATSDEKYLVNYRETFIPVKEPSSCESECASGKGKKASKNSLKHTNHMYKLLWKETSDSLELDKEDLIKQSSSDIDNNRVHSLVCQDLSHEISSTGDTIIFTYPELLPTDERDLKEINFFVSRHPNISIKVNGDKSSTFLLGDKIEISSGNHVITLSFHLIEGEGQFYGHLSHANRPSQKIQDKFQAFDYLLSLRTISRTPSVKIKATILMQENQQPIPLHEGHCLHIE